MEAYLIKIKRLIDELAARKLELLAGIVTAYTLSKLTPEYKSTVAIIS